MRTDAYGNKGKSAWSYFKPYRPNGGIEPFKRRADHGLAMSKIEFRLKKGMRGDDVLTELKGRTAGESRQELVQVFAKDTVDEVPFPRHEIVESDGEYALLRKTVVKRDRLNGILISQEYYLSGISDEGKYFLHPFDMSYLYDRPFSSMEDVMSWTNRAEDGYSMRVQGDVLLKFLPGSAIVPTEEPYKYRGPYTLKMPYSLARLRTLPSNHPRTEDCVLQEVPRKDNPVVNLGNHVVSTDGGMYIHSGYDKSLLIVAGSNVVLQHPEHGPRTVQIPKDHVAVLTGQRGRSLMVQGASIAGFD